MKKNRLEKLQKLEDKKAANGMVIMTDGGPFIEALQKKVDELRKILGASVEVNVDTLIDKLEDIESITPAVKELKQAIAEIEVPDFPTSVDARLTGIEQLEEVIEKHVSHLKGIKSYRLPDAQVQVEIVDNQKIHEVTDRLDNLIKVIGDNVYKGKQNPSEFIPIRRVKLVGSQLVFDDSYWGGGGGGGSNVPTVTADSNGIQAVPVVNPDGSAISAGGGGGGGDATAANQLTIIGHIDGVESLLTTIDADTSAIAGAIKSEDAGHSSGDSGIPLLTVRRDSAASSADTTGDYATLNTDNTGRLWVNIGAFTAASQPLPTGAATLAEQQTQTTALQLIDDIVHNGDATLSRYAVMGAVFDDASTATVTENNAQSLRMSSRRALYVETPSGGTFSVTSTALTTLAGTVITDGATAGTTLVQVGGTDGTNAQILSTNSSGHVNIADGGNTITVDGTVGANLSATSVGQVADNTAFTDGTTRVWMHGYIFDEVAGTALTENDAAAARIDDKRAQVIVGEDATTRGRRWTIDAGGALKVDGSAVTQPISHAALTELAAAIDTEVQVDVVGALPAGNNNIGDVDIATVPAPLNVTGGGTEAAALRVTIASDSTGVLSVDDNGSSLTVDGSLTAVPEKASSATIARTATSTTSATVLASNSSRKKAVIINESSAILYVKYGTTASATSYSYMLEPNDTLEETNYTGRIDAILASGTGNAQTTEL